MTIIDSTYYLDTYLGENPSDLLLLNKLIARATDDVNAKCNFVIDDDTVITEAMQKAVAAQTEYYVLNGENYNDDDSDNVKIGKYSYGGSGSKSTGAVQICPRALMFLEQSGLTNRSVDIYEPTYTY
jgi:flavoprotein